MRQPIKAAICDAEGTRVSETLTWSVESYVAQQLANDKTGEAMKNLATALLVYGDSAAAYLSAIK